MALSLGGLSVNVHRYLLHALEIDKEGTRRNLVEQGLVWYKYLYC
jgi:hypothetical protein